MEDTASLKSGEGKFCDYPDSTADAIYSGAMHAMAGAIERMAARSPVPWAACLTVFSAAAAAQRLQPQLNVNTTVMDNLVLEGLVANRPGEPEAPL